MTGPGVAAPEVLEPTSVVGTAWLAERCPGVDALRLLRWHRAGILRPYSAAKGPGSRATWPAWTARLLPLMGGSTSVSVTARRSYLGLIRLVADVLEEHPTVPWVVIPDDGAPVPAWSAEEAVAAFAGSVAPVIVSPPDLESVA